ncbi:MAG: ABC transporter substrate-binding protein [Deltaproteobacteria bacterium]|nr:ABC transporter substrate-binding protein [Deltaproteobacteria bacterium]
MKIGKQIAGGALVVWLLLSLMGFPVAVSAQAQKQPVVLALIEPLSGPFKDVGTEVAAFVEYGVEQLNAKGGVLGQPVKLKLYDNQMKPDVAIRMAKKAVLEDGAKIIMNNTNSAVGLALSKVAMELGVIHLILHNEADEIMGTEFQLNSFRVCLSTSMHSGILAHYFATTPHKRFYLLNQDYAFGHAVADSFKKMFQKVKRADQEIVGEEFHPMATKDFGPYVTKALALKPDVVITGNFGPDLGNLIKQSKSLGLKAIFGAYFLDSAMHISQAGEAALGSVTGDCYLATVKTKKNQEFVKGWQAWLKKNHPEMSSVYLVPSSIALDADAILWLGEVINLAKSMEAAKIIKAWEGMEYDGLTGKMTMRACDHQVQRAGFVGVMQANHAFRNIHNLPFLSGDPIVIPAEKITIPPKDTGNPRCK